MGHEYTQNIHQNVYGDVYVIYTKTDGIWEMHFYISKERTGCETFAKKYFPKASEYQIEKMK